jgi:hypothetical protein
MDAMSHFLNKGINVLFLNLRPFSRKLTVINR